ncbi:MAG: M56 family metallopeptidase [Actinomycetota bacterium]
MIFIDIIFNYIIPIIYDSFASLVFALVFLFIFRIKDSSLRIMFLFLPLVKPFVILCEEINIGSGDLRMPVALGGLRFPDPHNIVGRFENEIAIFSDLNHIIIFIIFSTIGFILILRWIHLFFFYRSLAYEEKVGRKDVPEIYSIIDNYAQKINIRKPDVSLTHRSYFSPFMIGTKRYTLVLSPVLLELLSEQEKETLIQHELSHIKRHDNLIGWPALILRDILFFNPFSHIAYALIKEEQEKGSDKLLLKYSGKPAKEIASNILNAIKKIKLSSEKSFRTVPAEGLKFSPMVKVNMRRIRNRVVLILNTNKDRISSRLFTKIVMTVLWIFFLLIQILIVVRIDDKLIFLR